MSFVRNFREFPETSNSVQIPSLSGLKGEFATARQSLESCWRRAWDLDEAMKRSEVETEESIHSGGCASPSGVPVVTE